MAMRFGHRICSYARFNKPSGIPTSLRGVRSFSSEASSVLPYLSRTAFVIAKVSLPCAVWAGLFYYTDTLGFRSLIEKRKAQKVILETVDRLKREKLKSEDAYVEMLDRDANALKEKLSKSDLDLWDTTMYYREVVTLKHVLEAEAEAEETRPDKESNMPQTA